MKKKKKKGSFNWATGRSSRWLGGAGVAIVPECRSYHLGWIVWSFGGRDDFRELTHHARFEDALRVEKRAHPSVDEGPSLHA